MPATLCQLTRHDALVIAAHELNVTTLEIENSINQCADGSFYVSHKHGAVIVDSIGNCFPVPNAMEEVA